MENESRVTDCQTRSESSPDGRAAEALRPSGELSLLVDRKSTRLNSSHVRISYAVFCLKKKKRQIVLDESRVRGPSGLQLAQTSSIARSRARRRVWLALVSPEPETFSRVETVACTERIR